MRKPLVALSVAAALLMGLTARARAEDVTADPIPPEFFQQFAIIAGDLIQKQIPDAPVKTELQFDKGSGYHIKQMAGVIVMPDKNLTADVVDKTTDKEVPVGVVATLKLTVQNQDMAVGVDKLALVDILGMAKIAVFFATVKTKGEDRTLELYTKTGTAVASVPLKKMATAGDKSVPVAMKITNIDLEKKKLDVSLCVSGEYETTVKMAMADF